MDNNTKASLLLLIESDYQTIANTNSNTKKAACFNNIIQTKYSIYSNDTSETYVDIKNYIKCYIASLEELPFQYDQITLDKVTGHIVRLPLDARVPILKWTSAYLKQNNFEDASKEIASLAHQTELYNVISNFKIRKSLKAFYLLTTLNHYAIILSLLFCFIILSIILLPSPMSSFSVLRYNPVILNTNVFVNHLANVIILIIGADEEVKIKPLNIRGLLLILAGKAIFVLLVANILIKKISEKFNLS